METTPQISILLPAFNAAATLPACLRSIQRQREPHWECVIVDDGSDDGTLACAQSFAAHDDRVVVVSTAHRGLIAALNTGIAHCRGDVIARMDADDLMLRDRLGAQIQALDAAPHLTAVGCHVRLFPRSHLQVGMRAYESWLNSIDSPERLRRDAYIECPLVHPTLMIRRDVLAAFGYRDCDWAEDYDLILRLLAGGHAIGIVPRRLLCWRDAPQRLTHVDARYHLARFPVLKAAFLAAHFLADTDTYILWGYGATGRQLHRALLVHGKRMSHLVEVDPGRLGNTIHGAAVIPPEQLPHVARHPIIASVAGETPRNRIRAALTDMGLCELRDFVCAA